MKFEGGYDVTVPLGRLPGYDPQFELVILSVKEFVQMNEDHGERLRSSDIWTIARHPWPRWLPLHSVTCRQDPHDLVRREISRKNRQLVRKRDRAAGRPRLPAARSFLPRVY